MAEVSTLDERNHLIIVQTVRETARAVAQQGLPTDILLAVFLQAAIEGHIIREGTRENFFMFANALYDVITNREKTG